MFKRFTAALVALALGVALSFTGAGAANAVVNDDGNGGGSSGGGGSSSGGGDSGASNPPDQSTSTLVSPVFPDATPPTCDAAGSLPALPTNQAGLTFSYSGLTMVAALENTGYAFKVDAHETHDYQASPSALGYQSTNSEGLCYSAPSTVTYETVVWSMPSPNTGTAATYPQVGFVQYTNEATETLDVPVPTTCGTQYQVDVYLQTNGAADNTLALDALFKAGLADRNNGDRDAKYLAGQSGNPGVAGFGQPWKLVKNADCVPPPPPITPRVCTTATTLPTSTDLAQQGWTLTHDSNYVAGGIELHSEGVVHGGVIDRAVSFALADAENLARDLTIVSGSGASFAIEMDTSTGATVTYEPAYTDKLWTDTVGILPRNNLAPNNNNGQGGPYSGSTADLLSNPTVTHIWIGIWNTTETAVLHSASFDCSIQAFGTAVAPGPRLSTTADSGPIVCSIDGMGGGSYVRTTHHFVQTAVFDAKTGQYTFDGTEPVAGSDTTMTVPVGFEVCPPQELSPVSAGDPTNTNQTCSVSGLVGGVIKVVITPHVDYVITYDAEGDVSFNPTTGETGPLAPGDYTVAVTAAEGYELTSKASYSLTISPYHGDCRQLVDHPIVTPIVTSSQLGCTTGGSYTLSNDLSAPDGVIWTVDGSPVSAGTYQVTSAGTVNVHAAPNGPSYGFGEGQQQDFTLTFARAASCDLKTLALHDGTLASTGTNPTGLLVLAGFLGLFGLALTRRARRLS